MEQGMLVLKLISDTSVLAVVPRRELNSASCAE
jgi:hypothetical protein